MLGLGAAGENLTVAGVRRKTLDDQHAFEIQKLQLGEMKQLQNDLAQHPEQAPFFLESAKSNPLLAGIDLSPLASAARTMGTQQLTSGLNSAPTPEAMPADLGQALTARTGQPAESLPTSSLLGPFGQEGQQENPTLNLLAQTAGSRLGQLSQAEDDKTALLNTRKQGEAYATAAGTNAANNENFPTKLGQESDLAWTKVDPAAATAGAEQDARNASDLNPATVAGKKSAAAGQAGAVADAEARARARVEYDPVNIANAAKRAGAIAAADAVAKGDTTRLKYIETSKENAIILAPQLSRLMTLYDKAKHGDLKAASLYSDLSNNLRPVIARATGYNGRMTNVELGIAGNAIPGLKDALLGTADSKFKFIRGLATYGPSVASQLPPDASIEEYMTTIQRMVDQEPPPAGSGATGTVKPGSTLNKLLEP